MNVLYCSMGIDSLATAIEAKFRGEQIERICYCRVMFDKHRGIPADDPENDQWIFSIAIPYLYSIGYQVDVIQSDRDFLDTFFHVITRGKNEGKIAGFPIPGRCVVLRDCKLRAFTQYKKRIGEHTEILGICAEETERLSRLKLNQCSLLKQWGMTHRDNYELCYSEGLLPPSYKNPLARSGCFFCPNKNLDYWVRLYSSYYNLFYELACLDSVSNKASSRFSYDKTFTDIVSRVEYAIDQRSRCPHQLSFDFDYERR